VLDPNFPEPINDIGTIYFQKGELDRAERHFREAFELDNTYYPASSNLLSLLFQKVITKIQQRRLSEPNEVEELAQLLQALKKHAPADSTEMRAACHNTQAVIASCSLSAFNSYQQGNTASALQILERIEPLIEALPRMSSRVVSIYWDTHGLYHHRLEQLEGALQCYRRSLAVAEQAQENSLIANTWQRIGSVHLARTQWEQVEVAFERSFQFIPPEAPKTVLTDGKFGEMGIMERLTTPLDFAMMYSKWGLEKRTTNALKDAEYCWLRAAEIAKAFEAEEIYGAVAITLSELYAQQGELDKAEAWAQQSKIPSTMSSTMAFAIDEYQKGKRCQWQNQNQQAIEHFSKALTGFQQAGEHEREADILCDVANCYRNIGQWEEAETYYQRSIERTEEIGYQKGVYAASNEYGLLHLQQRQFLEAERLFKRTLELSEQAGDEYYQALSLLNLGSVAIHQERYDEAYSQCQRSLRICERCGFIQDKVQNLRNLGIAFVKLGNFAEAERYTQESIRLSEELGNKRDKLAGYFTLCQIYATQTQPEKSSELSRSVQKTIAEAEELNAYDILGAAAAQIGPRLLELGELTAGADLYNAALTRAFKSDLKLFGTVLFSVLEQLVNVLNAGKKDWAIKFCNDSIEAATRSQFPQLLEAFQAAKWYLSAPSRAIDANKLAQLLFYPFANLFGMR
jgi:tetratricopeptide (TPR) repeat protein